MTGVRLLRPRGWLAAAAAAVLLLGAVCPAAASDAERVAPEPADGGAAQQPASSPRRTHCVVQTFKILLLLCPSNFKYQLDRIGKGEHTSTHPGPVSSAADRSHRPGSASLAASGSSLLGSAAARC